MPDNDHAAAFIRSVKTTPDFLLPKFGSQTETVEMIAKFNSSLLGFDIFNLHSTETGSTETGSELPSPYLSNIVSDISSRDTNLRTGFFIIKNI